MHEGLARKSRLRRFLSNFANDEALHYLVAKRDLLCVGLDVLPQPLDVTIWHGLSPPS